MASTPGQGSVLRVTISAVVTTIAQQTTFAPLTRKRAPIDFTALTDTQEQMLASTLKRGDEVAFTGWWDPANTTHAYLETSYAGGLTEVWTILYADAGAATISFSGFLTELTYGDVNIEGLVEISGKIKMTTLITLTP